MNMIERLFVSFDPLISTINLTYLSAVIPLTTPLFLNYYTSYFRFSMSWKIIIKNIFRELSSSINNNNKKIKTIILFILFRIILLLNIRGLMPYVYTLTRQIILTLRIAIPFWFRFILFRATHNLNNLLSHLVPLSSPLLLSQLMVIIETISQIIRPITLSVRLSANMTAGHILMALARKPILMINFCSMILLILLILETAVAIIQRYVFTILLSIYLSETTYE